MKPENTVPQSASAGLPPAQTLTQTMTTELLTGLRPVRIDTTLSYCSRAPFTVGIAFHILGGDVTVWRVDRDMITAGAHAPTGRGDLHLRPTGGDKVLLCLGPPGDTATVLADRDHLVEMVRQTYVLVPPGSESAHIDWQPFLDHLDG